MLIRHSGSRAPARLSGIQKPDVGLDSGFAGFARAPE